MLKRKLRLRARIIIVSDNTDLQTSSLSLRNIQIRSFKESLGHIYIRIKKINIFTTYDFIEIYNDIYLIIYLFNYTAKNTSFV